MIRTIRSGVIAGLVGSLTIWIYEWVVLHHFLRDSSSAGIVEHTAQLVFGLGILSRPATAFALGAAIHCLTGVFWGVGFAFVWRFTKASGLEASFLALPFGAFAWVVMHLVVLAAFSPAPPSYSVYSVINGLMSHTVAFATPVALCVKSLDSR